jgi:probable HAF family extracellular repeat protein
MHRMISSLVCAVLAWGCAVTVQAEPLPFTVTDLGTLGGNYSWASKINNNGQITGAARTPAGPMHAFLWDSGVMTDLGTLDGWESSEGLAINSAGLVAGQSYGGPPYRAFLHDGVMNDLGTLGGDRSTAYGMNDAGVVVGRARNASNETRAFRYLEGSGMEDLGTLGGNFGKAFDVNSNGMIVGESNVGPGSGGRYFGFRYTDDDGMVSLGSLNDVGLNSTALAVNDAGTVVGASAGYPVMWDKDGNISSLGGFGEEAEATDINNVGQIVGWEYNENDLYNGFLYEDGVRYDLNTLLAGDDNGWSIEFVNGINDLGQIVGFGASPSGETHAFLLTPVPEPSSALLLLVAAPLLRRRSR